MAELKSIEELPTYNQEYTVYRTAVREAEASGEESAKLRAELEWSNKQREFTTQLHQHNDSERRFASERERIAAEYPDVPREIFEGAATTEMMETQARLFHEKLAEHAPPAHDQTPPPPPSAGQPPTGVGGDRATLPDWKQREEALAGKIRDGKASRRDVEEYQNIRVNMRMLPSIERARQEAKSGR